VRDTALVIGQSARVDIEQSPNASFSYRDPIRLSSGPVIVAFSAVAIWRQSPLAIVVGFALLGTIWWVAPHRLDIEGGTVMASYLPFRRGQVVVALADVVFSHGRRISFLGGEFLFISRLDHCRLTRLRKRLSVQLNGLIRRPSVVDDLRRLGIHVQDERA